jgi:hypothetical protein
MGKALVGATYLESMGHRAVVQRQMTTIRPTTFEKKANHHAQLIPR